MIDLKQLREHPQRFRDGAAKKGIEVEFDRLLRLDEEHRGALNRRETLRAEQKRLEKESGPQIGKLKGAIGKAPPAERPALEAQLKDLLDKPSALKAQIAELDAVVAGIEPQVNQLLLTIPLPPDADVPVGRSADDNVEIRRWSTPGFDPAKPFEAQRGFKPRTHIDLVASLRLADFPRGVRMAGSRSYVLTGAGMLLHQALLRYAFDFMAHHNGFTPMSVPVVVREECMVGTGFFPAGREQAYHIEESKRGGTHDLFLTGTGEVGLMGIHQDEIIDESLLPLKYVTVSTCFRREAGAAGKDTAGLYRIHQFDKVEQVVICKADETESRQWHKKMLGYVESLLQSLELPYRLLQCCTGDLGPKNADMVDVECWMPGRGNINFEKLDASKNYIKKGQPETFFVHLVPSKIDEFRTANGDDFNIVLHDGNTGYSIPYRCVKEILVPEMLTDDDEYNDRWYTRILGGQFDVQRKGLHKSVDVHDYLIAPPGDFGETHSASRLYDYQCRRLNMRYRPGGQAGKGPTTFCHSLNNTVGASPRLMIPILEMHQQADGSVTIPTVLRPYMGGMERIG